MAKLKAGVMGAGVFGGYHAGKFFELEQVQLTSIFDKNLTNAKRLAQKFNANTYSALSAFLESVDIVTIASPAQSHYQLAKACLMSGKSVLVEKPLAATFEEGSELVAIAAQKQLTLAVGHQERAVANAIGLMKLVEKPVKIQAVRYGPWSERGSDVSVTLDLMIHDLDLVGALFGENPMSGVKASGEIKHSRYFDTINAELEFEDGSVAELKASRLQSRRERWMKITYPSGELFVDFVDRRFENDTGFSLNADFANTPEGQDPLGWNVTQFVKTVTGESEAPLVTGLEGLRALKWAQQIDEVAR